MSDRGTLRTRVRRDAQDRESVSWTNEEVDDALNRAAQYVAEELARHNIVRQMMGTETLTTAANDRDYTLTATNIMEVKYLYWANPNTNGQDVLCDSVDDDDRDSWQGRNSPYYVEVDSSASTRLSIIHFLYVPRTGQTYRAEYVKMPAVIVTGSGDDNESYSTIPIKYEEAIVARAVWWLTSVDGAQREAAAARFGDIFKQAIQASKSGKPGNDRIKKF